VSGELESLMRVRARLIEQARALGASLAGIASVTALKDSSSHAAGGLVDCPAQAKSVLVIALAHPATEPELDWWDGKVRDSPGNRRLIRIADDLSSWLAEEFSVSAHPLPYQVHDGGIHLKDAAALAGLGVVGRNNLLITPDYGPRVRLRALFVDLDLAPSGPTEFAPCEGCEMPCQNACPKRAFISGAYSKALCNVQMMADEARKVLPRARRDSASLVAAVKYCRACELACPVPG
jgi:epoxyqueuosine reductase